MRVWACLTGLAAGVLLFATQTLAQGVWPGGPGSTSPLVPGQLFVGFGAQVGVYNLPRFDSPWRSSEFHGPGAANQTDVWRPAYDPDPIAAGPSAVFGYVFDKGALPSWMGQKVRLSLGTQFWHGNYAKSEQRGVGQTLGPAAAIQVAPIDGSLGSQSNFAVASLTARSASLNLDTDGFELSLRLASDFAVAPRLTVSPFLTVFGGQSRESYTLRTRLTAAADAEIYSLDERISTARVGLMFGTGVTARVRRAVTVHLSARAGLVWMRARMTGADCFASRAASSGTSCGAAPAGFGDFRTSVSDTRSTAGFRGGLTAGVSWDMRFAVLSLTGFMAYDSRVPGIANPVVTTPMTGIASANNLPTSGRARLFFDDAINYGGMVVLRFPLNAPGG